MKNKTILFICALPAELNCVKNEVKKLRLVGITTKFFLSGVGNYRTLYNVKNYLDSLDGKPDFLVNIGLCGKIPLAKDQYFQVYRILGAANGRELLCPVYIDHLKKSSLVSSEKVITSEDKMQGEAYVDMESYAIDIIGTEEKIPYILIKKPFDTISVESKKIDPKKFEGCLSDFDYDRLLQDIHNFIEKNYDIKEEQRQYFLNETLKYLHLTVSEKEIWKKGYARLVSSGGDYQVFLEKHKDGEKKDFLEKLTK